jgi:hypothetical protein
MMALGGAGGASALSSRYKDDPGAAIKSWSAIFYTTINCVAILGRCTALAFWEIGLTRA